MSTEELPPGFRRTADHKLVFDDGHSLFLPVWEINGSAPQASGLAHLSRGEVASIRKLGKPCYLTPKTGRPGWNVRKSFPKDGARREVGFIEVAPGLARRFTPRRAKIRRDLT